MTAAEHTEQSLPSMTRRPLLLLLLALARGARSRPAAGPSREARARDGRVRRRRSTTSATRRSRSAPRRGACASTSSTAAGSPTPSALERGEDKIVAKVSSLLPGDRASQDRRVRKGTYRFFCALSNHEELGMYGTLVVR